MSHYYSVLVITVVVINGLHCNSKHIHWQYIDFWTEFGALDMDRMIEDVDKWKERSSSYKSDCTMPILIIEGFLIFNHR